MAEPVQDQPPREDSAARAHRRAELLHQLADLRRLRERLRPLRTKIDRDRAALLRTLGRL